MASCLLMPTCGAASPTPSLACMVAVMSRTRPRVVPLKISSFVQGCDFKRSAGLPIRKMFIVVAAVGAAVAPLKREPTSDVISIFNFTDKQKLKFQFLFSVDLQKCLHK
jgi:hypothetical protein